MRPLTRQSARLASSSRARAPSVPRQRIERQRRSFHISSQRSSDPRTPGASDNHTPSKTIEDFVKKHEADNERHDEGAVLENGEAKTSSFPRPGRQRTTLRQRRMNDVPKPPPIPDWFLKHNVHLVEGIKEYDGRKGGKSSTIRCVDTETGHTLFVVEDAGPLETDAQEALDQNSPADEDSNPGRGTEATSSEPQVGVVEEHSADASGSPEPDTPYEPPRKLNTHLLDEATFIQAQWLQDPLKWSLLEAETSVRAAFSLANENQPSSLYATDKVDLSLQCADPNSHEQLEEFVYDLARHVKADVIQFDANDFAELSDDYVGQGDDAPGSISNLAYEVFDGYVATGATQKSNKFRMPPDQDEDHEFDEDDEADEADQAGGTGGPFGTFVGIGDLKKALQSSPFRKALGGPVVGIGIGGSALGQHSASMSQQSKQAMQGHGGDTSRGDARLSALFGSLLDAGTERRAAFDKTKDGQSALQRSRVPEKYYSATQKYQRSSRLSAQNWQSITSGLVLSHLGTALEGDDPTKPPFRLQHGPIIEAAGVGNSERRTIVHVRDLRDISESRMGENVIRNLSKVVGKRRRAGERIMIVGTTAQDVPGPFNIPGDHSDDFPFRMITLPPCWTFEFDEMEHLACRSPPWEGKNLDEPAYNRILDINLRHVQSMLGRMRPEDNVDMCSAAARKQLNLDGMYFLAERVLSQDQVQRLALTAVGLAETHAKSDTVYPLHVALAGFINSRSDHMLHCCNLLKDKLRADDAKSESGGEEKGRGKHSGERGKGRIDRIKKSLNQHETRLLTGVVDAEKIKVGFGDVHAVPETIDALKTVTSLSLLRPDAFKYGVLANDRLPGLLLYGPPGTGKTLLAKAVAKESKATVLEVSGAQIYEKYVGEGEKMVRAVFSLAKKLSPCVVFVDEADAIFGSRSNAGNRNTHREIINQFLREWDGMDDHGCFMMVATNRPFDLDDAVLRRLPRRLLVDLPVAKDRESILGIHLRNEALDSSVSLARLAEQTPFYSGSDLKNLSVAAALACVREENELAEVRKDDTEFKFPDKRTLTSKHFDKALSEVSASVSEDMSSLTAIRKFDEQFGDRKGRRKKMGYGFGLADGVIDESAVRVRQDSNPSATPP